MILEPSQHSSNCFGCSGASWSWLCCGIFAALSLVLYVCIYGLVTINILPDEWDRTATRESQLLTFGTATAAVTASARRDQDLVQLLAQPSDFERWSKFSIVVAISPKLTEIFSVHHTIKPFHRNDALSSIFGGTLSPATVRLQQTQPSTNHLVALLHPPAKVVHLTLHKIKSRKLLYSLPKHLNL